MIEKLLPGTHHAEETLRRSVVKTVSYRLVILILDFASILFIYGQNKGSAGFYGCKQCLHNTRLFLS